MDNILVFNEVVGKVIFVGIVPIPKLIRLSMSIFLLHVASNKTQFTFSYVIRVCLVTRITLPLFGGYYLYVTACLQLFA